MKKILVSAFRCNTGLHAAYSTFRWAEVLGELYDVKLGTPAFNIPAIEKYYSEKGKRIPYEIIPINVHEFKFKTGSILKTIEKSFKPGFFLFENKLLDYIKKNRIDKDIDIVFRLSPTSPRFFSSLWKLNKPFLVGMLNGGLHPPQELKIFFKDEPTHYKLRHFDNFLFGNKSTTKYLDKADIIFTGVDFTKNILPKRVHHKVIVIPGMGIDEIKYKSDEKKFEKFTFLFAGRFTRYKGGLLLLKAFQRLVKQHPHLDVRLEMVGKGEEKEVYEEFVASYLLSDKVNFNGWKTQAEVEEFMRKSHAFVFPSITEGLGNIYLEALSVGIPTICTNYGGGGYIIKNGAGIKIDVDEEIKMIEGYKEAMYKVASDKDFFQELQLNTLELAKEYQWPSLKEQMKNAIDNYYEKS